MQHQRYNQITETVSDYTLQPDSILSLTVSPTSTKHPERHYYAHDFFNPIIDTDLPLIGI